MFQQISYIRCAIPAFFYTIKRINIRNLYLWLNALIFSLVGLQDVTFIFSRRINMSNRRPKNIKNQF